MDIVEILKKMAWPQDGLSQSLHAGAWRWSVACVDISVFKTSCDALNFFASHQKFQPKSGSVVKKASTLGWVCGIRKIKTLTQGESRPTSDEIWHESRWPFVWLLEFVGGGNKILPNPHPDNRKIRIGINWKNLETFYKAIKNFC